MGLIRSWLINAAALYATARLLAGVRVDSPEALIGGALAIGLVNAVIRPILRVVTFPITVLTLGLFYFVLNGLMFYLAASLIPGFELAGLVAAVGGALVMSIVATVLHVFLKPRRKK
ncbi:phage holin family protein [Candidatus Palauibacter polyketidifaciens]|uniref:phage holin family protein n=1 Tax=Candidatus Palauibacter polyketidifaciens TaxID=3056740 RepID=UPI00139E251D|nr:phage holin family protein [Candidatus Palauibacter polyketidifaciens]MDE2720716.1 phage holin family protein [Candidatus Palauibacter polyketidifaciens]MYE35745.1 phage holin family protein [Gemmatimonadales bacterium]